MLNCEKENKYTAKEIAFVDGLIQGKTQHQAFLDAGYSNLKGNSDAVDQKASKLLAKDKVRARFYELNDKVRDKVEKKLAWTLEEATEKLRQLIKEAEDSEVLKMKTGDKIDTLMKPLKELNSIYGLNKQVSQGELTIKTERTLEDLLCKKKNGQ